MSRHISIGFDQIKWDGVVFVFAAKFKEKFAKFLIEADLDGLPAGCAAPGGVIPVDIVPHLFAIGLGRLPVNTCFGGIEDLVAKGLGGGGLEADDVILDGGVI